MTDSKWLGWDDLTTEARGTYEQRWIEDFMNEITRGSLKSRTQAMRALKEAITKGTFALGISKSSQVKFEMHPKYIYQHAKLYIADEEKMVLRGLFN